MATITLLRSGAWRVQVRRKGSYVAETFLRKTEAQSWANSPSMAASSRRGVASRLPRRGRRRSAILLTFTSRI